MRDTATYGASGKQCWDSRSLFRWHVWRRDSRDYEFLAWRGGSNKTATDVRLDVAGKTDPQYMLQRAILYSRFHEVVY